MDRWMERQEPKKEKQEPRATRHFQFRSPQSCVSLSPFISRADWWWEILFFYLICREYSHTFSYYNPDWFRRAPYKCVGLYGLLTSFSVRSLFLFMYIIALRCWPSVVVAVERAGNSESSQLDESGSRFSDYYTIDSRDCCCLPVAPLVTAILLLTFADVGKLFPRLLRADANRY